MLDKLINRRRALSFLPTIGSRLCLPSLPVSANSSPRGGPEAVDVRLLPFAFPSEWCQSALVGFGQSGHEVLADSDFFGLNWNGNKYLALIVSDGCHVAGALRPEEAANIGADERPSPRQGRVLVVLAGDLLADPYCRMAQIIAQASRKAGHVVAIVPAIPHEHALNTRDLTGLFADDAACIVVSSASLEPDDTDQLLRTLDLVDNLRPFALALEKWGSAGIAARIATRPGLYKVNSAHQRWSPFEQSGPEMHRLFGNCFEREGDSLREAELLSFTASPALTRKGLSAILRTAHRQALPIRPLITIRNEPYFIGEEYELTLRALLRAGAG